METTDIIVKKMIDYNAPDMKRINHALKVTAFSQAISFGENVKNEDRKIIECAAVLHDIGIHEAEKQYGCSDGKLQEKLGPDIALKLLVDADFTDAEKERVCFLIGHHHTYNIDDFCLQILIEADFIVNSDEGDFPDGTDYRALKTRIFKTKTGTELFEKLILADKN